MNPSWFSRKLSESPTASSAPSAQLFTKRVTYYSGSQVLIMFCDRRKRKLGNAMTENSNDSWERPLVCCPPSATSTIASTEKNEILETNTVSKRRRHGSKEGKELGSIMDHNFGSTIPREIDEMPFALDPDGPDTPDEFLRKLLSSFFDVEIEEKQTNYASASQGFFDKCCDDDMLSYSVLAPAARSNKVPEMLKLSKAGYSLICCNRFGESLLHIACRRGFHEMVKLILDQPEMSVRIVDDCGRTPLHDLCWNPSPQLEICKWILEKEPSLFLLRDKRNFSPFDYTRQEHWVVWKRFLLENKELFKKMKRDCYGFLKVARVVDTQLGDDASDDLEASSNEGRLSQ